VAEENGKNGNGRGVFSVATAAIRRLSPDFIAILILNTVILCGLLWLFSKQSDSRERVLAPLLEACAHSVPIEALRMLPKPNE
jgi:hypothetical protein